MPLIHRGYHAMKRQRQRDLTRIGEEHDTASGNAAPSSSSASQTDRNEMQKLLLNDGAALEAGKGAIYAFVRSLLKLRARFSVDAPVLVVLDSREPTFRHELCERYKRDRPKTSLALRYALDRVPEAVNACGVQWLRVDGFEADDLLASCARHAVERHSSLYDGGVVVVSPDKDLHQVLAIDGVRLFDPTSQRFIGADDTLRKFGVRPDQVAGVQALSGDKVDGVPGVAGIGAKTAAQLIGEQFGSWQALCDGLESVAKPRVRDALLGARDDLPRMYRMVKLLDDIDESALPLRVDEVAPRPLDVEQFSAYCGDMGFRPIAVPVALRSAAAARALERTPAPYPLRASMVPDDTVAVQDRETARRVAAKLRELRGPGAPMHACDTEAVDISVKQQSPVGNGRVICASIYAGPDVDFGGGRSRVWIDNMDAADGVLDEFRDYFEDADVPKVWHNYSFDRHMLGNHGIDVRGLGGDTMHMARLWDASRISAGGSGTYSLASLTADLLGNAGRKRSMVERFSVHPLKKDGTPAVLAVLPPLDGLQRSAETVHDWIDYSVYDAVSTWLLKQRLDELLAAMPWSGVELTMLDYYNRYWRPFGELLTDMEREGIYVDRQALVDMQALALSDRHAAENKFLAWASRFSPDAVYMNVGSDAQKRQLFFAPYVNAKTGEHFERDKVFRVDNIDGYIDEGRSKPSKTRPITLRGFGLPVLDRTASGLPAASTGVLRQLVGNKKTPSSDDNKSRRRRRPRKNANNETVAFDGAAFESFGGGQNGAEACEAIASLVDVSAVSQLLDTFIEPLQHRCDARSRVHTSMNLNTETGRLSCRSPNLQNQPAMEKDRYGIRGAFRAERGNKLIVADYGQLELRLLAHVSECRSMIDAFAKGGDFHSRTALGMYPHVAQAVERGDVLLEWDGAPGATPPKPLLKDKFGEERKRGKTLNFSIAYGKTAHGLANDWGVTVPEARKTLELWFSDRPEVREWQRCTIAEAARTGATRTLMGRYRPLPGIRSKNRGIRSHSERAAINTPLQGGAADVVMSAMLLIHKHERLNELGWKMLLQIHDELIFEGPEESAEEALAIVVDTMSSPFASRKLLVGLVVDASIGNTWLEAK
jgi:DNA polymerase I